jgi:hypothetical protein
VIYHDVFPSILLGLRVSAGDTLAPEDATPPKQVIRNLSKNRQEDIAVISVLFALVIMD